MSLQCAIPNDALFGESFSSAAPVKQCPDNTAPPRFPNERIFAFAGMTVLIARALRRLPNAFFSPRAVLRRKMSAKTAAIIPLHRVAADSFARDNVVFVRLLSLCPMLAVSASVSSAAALGALTAAVMAFAGFFVSLLRAAVPDGVRLPVFLLIVAALVAAADAATAAFAPEMHRRLGIFLPLIITNCAVLARLELFARRRSPAAAFADGLAAGGGMLAAIVALAAAREWLATGGIAPFFSGAPLLSSAGLPAVGFMLFGLLIAAARALKLPAA